MATRSSSKSSASASASALAAKTAAAALAGPVGTVTLKFQDQRMMRHVDDPVHKDLSAAARIGDTLFVCCDETAGVDRLTWQDDPAGGHWGNHEHISLGEMIELPGGPGGEMDIEGLAADDGWLWIVASHSLKRGKPDGDDPGADLKAMGEIKRDPNRSFLGRMPLVEDADGQRPLAAADRGRFAHLKTHKDRSKLQGWLKGDPHLGASLTIPSKENGFDIEGIAASGLRIWLGLRGPVLRDHAVILELDLKVTRSGHLKGRRIDGKRRYRKHLIPTRGLGIRDLVLDGSDMLILTGPTMAGDGPASILRWTDAAKADASGVVPRKFLEKVIDLPYRGQRDHPEGLTEWDGKDRWLVLYDSPADERLTGDDNSVTGDVWKL